MKKIPNLPNYIFAFGALLWTLTYLGDPYINLPRILYGVLLITGIAAQIIGWILISRKNKKPHK